MTVLLIRGDGRSTWALRVPYWVPAGVRSGALLAVMTAAFIGWQMQALFGLTGPHVQLAALNGGDERYGMFERLAPESDGPTRSELARRSALSRAARLGLGDRRAASLIWMGTLEPAWRQDADRASHDGTLLWPVEARFVRPRLRLGRRRLSHGDRHRWPARLGRARGCRRNGRLRRSRAARLRQHDR